MLIKGFSLSSRFTSITSIDYMSMCPECQIGVSRERLALMNLWNARTDKSAFIKCVNIRTFIKRLLCFKIDNKRLLYVCYTFIICLLNVIKRLLYVYYTFTIRLLKHI